MACDPSLPQLGCCGGTIVAAREVKAFCFAQLHFVCWSTTPGTCWTFFKKITVRYDDLLSPEGYWKSLTETFTPRARTSVISYDGHVPAPYTPETYPFPGSIPQGWQVDVPLNPGGFVSERQFKPGNAAPSDPWQWKLKVDFAEPYTEAEAMAEFMALFNQLNVMSPQIDLCRGANNNVGGIFAYDATGIVNRFSSPTVGLSCRDGPLTPRSQGGGGRGGAAGFTKFVGASATSIILPELTDMGARAFGVFDGRKLRVRMDRSACIWRYQAATPCSPQFSGTAPNVPVCGAPGCTFIPLPTQDVPGCPAIWPRYVEFGLLPDGLDPVTGVGEPTPDVWYEYAGCTECFTSA